MIAGWEGGKTQNPQDTIALGKGLANHMEPGDVYALTGDLASGKTTFIKGVMKGLKYAKEVTSPTFTLINEYDAQFSVIHIDCYREDNLDRWIKLGLHDYMNENNIVIIEWADKMNSLLPDDSIHIQFNHRGMNQREISL